MEERLVTLWRSRVWQDSYLYFTLGSVLIKLIFNNFFCGISIRRGKKREREKKKRERKKKKEREKKKKKLENKKKQKPREPPIPPGVSRHPERWIGDGWESQEPLL